MKKFAICTILVLGVMVYMAATPPAYAKEQCIIFTNFCDRLDVNTDTYGNVYGMWDWVCDGVDATNILGHHKVLGTRPTFASGFAYYYTFWFLFDKPSKGLFDMYGTDGHVSFVQQSSQPFSVANGSCGFGVPRTGPSTTGHQK
jgi:hypothetical protein